MEMVHLTMVLLLFALGTDKSEFTIEVSGSSAISASTNPSSGNDISDVFGTDPRGSKNVYAYNYFENFSSQQDKTLNQHL